MHTGLKRLSGHFSWILGAVAVGDNRLSHSPPRRCQITPLPACSGRRQSLNLRRMGFHPLLPVWSVAALARPRDLLHKHGAATTTNNGNRVLVGGCGADYVWIPVPGGACFILSQGLISTQPKCHDFHGYQFRLDNDVKSSKSWDQWIWLKLPQRFSEVSAGCAYWLSTLFTRRPTLFLVWDVGIVLIYRCPLWDCPDK